MSAPITEFRASVKSIVDIEFSAEGLVARNDKLHESLGHDGAVASVYPNQQAPGESGIVQNMLVTVQLYNRYDLEVDPEQRVDPAVIEGWVHRFERAVQAATDPNTDHVYYYNIVFIEYPPDPTDNISRAHIQILGYGDNAALIETTA